MKIIIYFITMYCLLKVHCGQGQKSCLQYLSNETLSVSENEFINLTFWLNTSKCKNPSGDYRMEVETRRTDGSKEFDGKLVRKNNLCSITLEKSVRCTSGLGPAELFRKVNRSHAEIAVIVRWKDDASGPLNSEERTIKLNVSYPQTVTNHTVNGRDINSERSRFEMPLIKDNTVNGNVSKSLILWIVMPTGLCLLAAIIAICVYRRRARRNTKAKHDTEEKTKDKWTLKPKISWILPHKQMSKNHNENTVCIDDSLLTVKSNETEDNVKHHQQVVKQEDLLQLLFHNPP